MNHFTIVRPILLALAILTCSCSPTPKTSVPPAPASQPSLMPTTDLAPTSKPAEAPCVNTQPDVPFLPKPPAQPADWIVEHDPVTPNASPEARALLKYLYAISNQHTMTGQHNYAAQQEISTAAALKVSHKTPIIYGTDWGFSKQGDKDSAYVRQATVDELIKQYKAGSIIAITWHEVRPTEDEPVTFKKSVQGKLTDAEFDEVITPGTNLYNRWCAQVDIIAGYLKQLQNAHVPVLFRPYHEMNGDWFWWGGRRGDHGTKVIYRQIWDRFVNHHKLTNLIWIWNVDQPTKPDRQFVDYFPGQQYVDVLTLDDYSRFQQSYYDDLNALSDGKVMAIAETANPPAISVYADQPKWTYYMLWAGVAGSNWHPRPRPDAAPHTPLAEMVKNPRMFSLEDQSYWDAIAPVRIASGLPPTTMPSTRAQKIKITPNKASCIYDINEPIIWKVEAIGDNPASVKQVNYNLKKCGLTIIKQGTLDLSSGPATLETSLDEPGTILAEITTTINDKPVRVLAGAAIAPYKVQPASTRPDDFDAFWSDKIKELEAIPPNAQLQKVDVHTPNVDYSKIEMDNIHGTHIYGQLAKPSDTSKKYPALLIPQWAGVYGLPQSRVVDRARNGWIALNIMPHDLPFDQPDSYYRKLFRTTYRNYWTFGADNRDTTTFLRMYLSCYRAMDYLTQMPEWDGKNLVVMGTSQGGQQAIMIAGLYPRVTAILAMVPSSCDVTGPTIGRAIGYPNWYDQAKEKHNDAILQTARYFDPINFASRIKCPSLISPGLRDETSPPTGVFAAFNQIQAPKELLILINSNHSGDNNAQAPYNNRAEVWLKAIAQGKPVPPN
jgi:cephalosporin-C deacetylase